MNKLFVDYKGSLRLIVITFLMWGFITVINGFLLNQLVDSFHLSRAESDVLTYIFFGVYLLISYPASILIEKVGYKEALKIGMYVAASSVFPMVTGARLYSYELVVLGTFILASGIAILQVSANMYIILLGKPDEAASRITFAQALNSAGTWVAPLIGTLIKDAEPRHLTDPQQIDIFKSELVVLPYVLFAVIFVGMAVFIKFSELPVLDNFKKLGTNVKGDESKKYIFQYKHVILGALAICCYVGAEVSIGNHLKQYIVEQLQLIQFKDFIGYIIPYYWGSAMVGRFIGSNILRYVAANRLLFVASVMAIVFVMFSILSNSVPGMIFILGVGIFNSIMFPIIFYLGSHGMGKLSARASGLLVTGIVGGALILWIFNQFEDNLKLAFVIPIICYLFIAFYGIWGYRYPKKQEI